MRGTPALAAACCALVLAAGCSSSQPAAAPSGSPSPAAPSATGTTPAGPSSAPAVGTAPLTGAPITDAAVLQRPALAVKIENTAAARPQSGLDAADIVYEELVEGGITRFIAVFHSQVPPVVGPIRSARLVDPQVLPAYHGVLVYSGARDEVNAALRRAGIPLLSEGSPGVYRTGDRKAPHNLMGDGPRLFDAAAAKQGAAPASAVWPFSATPPAGAVACPSDAPDCGSAIQIRMSRVTRTGWQYDSASGLYRRSQNGEPTRVTGPGVVGAANVVVLGMDISSIGGADPAGNPLVHTEVIGSGKGIVLRDGKRYPVTWSKASATAHFVLTGPDGQPLPLKPGPTWVHLAPAGAL